GTWRSHQVPMADVRGDKGHLRLLEDWLRSYRPEELFNTEGTLAPELRALPPQGELRMSASPHANGGVRRDLVLPDFRDYAVEVRSPGTGATEANRVQPPRRRVRNDCADLGGRDEADRRGPGARRARDGGALGAPLPGLARGL